jgi:DNA invertase Pin-like site-specific DNA recombinase
MNDERRSLVKPGHLAREAYLYVRQATAGHGPEGTERLQRQYALRQQAVALGWPAERVIVIDSDLEQSGFSATVRRGFQELVRLVRRRCVGLVLAWDPSRLARNFRHWHRLLEACAGSDTLLLDQERLYNPRDPGDRVLLGCDGTMPVRKIVESSPPSKEALV